MDENPSSDDKVEEIFKLHRGKPVIIQYVGGEHHGEQARLRRPLKKLNEVAKPTRYLGNNFYDSNVGSVGYETYVLKDHEGVLYYVVKEWEKDFPECITWEHEPTNHKLIRKERERGGPVDLVEHGSKEDRELLNQNLVGRCDKCLRGVFDKGLLGKTCNFLKPSMKDRCDGVIKPIAEFAKDAKLEVKARPRGSSSGARTEEEKAQEDFKDFGIAFLVDGKRVHPAKVRMMVRTVNPLTISLKDLIGNGN